MKHLLTLFIAVLAFSGFAQKSLPIEVVKSVEERIANGYSPSIAIGVIDKDGPQYYLFGAKTAGGQPVNAHTIYEIVSSTTSDRLVSKAIQDSHSISLRPESGNGVKTKSDPSV